MSTLTTTPTTANATETITWQIDPAHTNVAFGVRHLMISTVRGRFAGVTGTVRVEGDDPATAVIDVTIDAASIDTREPQRDAHLRSADFLDVEHFPTLQFRSTRVTRDEDDIRVTGDLTIRGVTREVTLAVEPQGYVTDPWGAQRVGYTATTKINRRDFGLVWNVILETGGLTVGDEVKISIELEATKGA